MELANLLHPSKLTTLHEIEHVVEDFNAQLTVSSFLVVFEGTLKEKVGSLPALILSTLGERPSLSHWFFAHTTKTDVVVICTILSKILIQLSTFFLEHPLAISLSGRTIATICEYHSIVPNAPHVLQGLFALTTVAEGSKSSLASSSTDVKAKIPGRRESAFKKALREIDEELFRKFEIPIPMAAHQVEAALEEFRQRLVEILKFYMSIFHDPEFERALKSRILTEATQAYASGNLTSGTNLTSSDYTLQPASAFPAIQPLKSATYFESVEGFGDWRLLISSRADSDLRACSRKDRASFKIIARKLRALSKGHFSADNQKMLALATNGIPIYEAKMSGDRRIVYHVDLQEEGEEALIQVLKIIGAQYTHAHINSTNWHALSRQLGKRGTEYRKHCTIREDPVRHGNDTCGPASFDKAEFECEKWDNTDETLQLPPDDLEQLHALIGQEKFVEFSKPLLYNLVDMLAGLDDHFPFAVSAEERKVIEDPASCYVLGRSGTGKTITILRKMLEIERLNEVYAQDMVKQRQLFVTRSRILVKKVEKQFKEEMEALRTTSLSPEELKQLAISRNSVPAEVELVDEEDRAQWRADLPKKFSELEDKHFPLFISFDDMCTLLEADLLPSPSYQEMLDYNRFRQEYWDHLPLKLRHRLDPSLVFNEIIGVICGSEATLSAPNRYLEQAAYENLGPRTHPVFAENRTLLYKLFCAVLKRKRRLGDLDVAQRTHNILKSLKEHNISLWKVYRVYVDEVQDHLLIDALLLRSLCNNPNGLHWAGDTAQTISRGSSFSFEELKSFLHRVEVERRKVTRSLEVSYQTISEPAVHQLTTNYRSHNGIVKIASSIVELIVKLWPESIDKLERERGVVPGLKPVFFEGSIIDHKDKLFPKSGMEIAFGAEQCILVRDEDTRKQLETEIGKSGLIFTIHESKGLEFNDVLIYNFFNNSDVGWKGWKVVLNAVEQTMSDCHIPAFSESQHAGLCLELKMLYVAITRARNRLWIADDSAQGEPMKTFWKSRGEIESCLPADYSFLTEQSTSQQWTNKGHELFMKRHYLQARQCYENGHAPHAVAISNAYLLRERALQTSRSSTNSKVAFKMAASAFLRCSEDVMNTTNKIDYLREAGKCFESSSDNMAALDAYWRAEAYDRVAQLFMKTGMFKEALEVIQTHRHTIEPPVYNKIQADLRTHYFVSQDFNMLDSLFRCVDDQIKYFSEANRKPRLEHLVHHKRFDIAAELELEEGQPTNAIKLFLQGHHYNSAKEVVLRELWHGTIFKAEFPMSVSELLNQAKMLQLENKGKFTPAENDELDLFGTILTRSRPDERRRRLLGSAQVFSRSRHSEAYLISLDQYFSTVPWIFQQNHDVFKILETLEKFIAYVKALRNLTMGKLGRSAVVRLLGLRQHGAGVLEKVFVPQSSALYQRGTQGKEHLPLLSISSEQMMELARDFFGEVLLERVRTENKFLQSYALRHLYFSHEVMKSERNCGEGLETAITGYRALFASQMSQIFIVSQAVEKYGSPSQLASTKLFWLRHMFHALHALGPASAMILVSATHTASFADGVEAARVWISDADLTTGRHSHLPPAQLLTFALSTLGFLASFDQSGFGSKGTEDILLTLKKQVRRQDQDPREPDPFLEKFITLVAMYDQQQTFEVGKGVEFLVTILQVGCSIDIDIFFNVLETVCALFTVSQYYAMKETYSGLVLPRSWLYVASAHPYCETQPKDFGRLFALFEILLKGLCLGQGFDQFLHGINGQSICSARQALDPLHDKFICRTLTSLGLVGLNLHHSTFRGKVLAMIQGVYSASRSSQYSELAKSFLQVTRWSQMAHPVRQSVHDSPIDGLIRIDEKGCQQDPPIPGVRIVMYQDFFEDIPPFLRRWAETPGLKLPLATQETRAQDESFSDRRREAYYIIAKYTRRFLRRCDNKALILQTQDTYEYQYFRCLQLVEEARWPPSTYRILFLAIVPHLLHALWAAKDALHDREAEIKAMRYAPEREEAGTIHMPLPVDDEQTAINSLSKSVLALSSALELTSNVHSTQDTDALKELKKDAMRVLGIVCEMGLDEKFRGSFDILLGVCC